MGCKACEAAKGRTPSQRAQRRRPPGKPEPMRVATKSRARGVALLGVVVSATTFVALLAIIAILSATRLMENLIRGSLKHDSQNTFTLHLAACNMIARKAFPTAISQSSADL